MEVEPATLAMHSSPLPSRRSAPGYREAISSQCETPTLSPTSLDMHLTLLLSARPNPTRADRRSVLFLHRRTPHLVPQSLSYQTTLFLVNPSHRAVHREAHRLPHTTRTSQLDRLQHTDLVQRGALQPQIPPVAVSPSTKPCTIGRFGNVPGPLASALSPSR